MAKGSIVKRFLSWLEATLERRAVFSIVNAALLRELPYRDAQRLVFLYEPLPGIPNVPLEGWGVVNGDFRVLGVSPALGRTVDHTDTEPGHGRVAVISDSLWRSQFASDPNVLG